MPNILIVYYSRKGQNYWNGAIKNLEKGNTEIAAEYVRDAVGGDVFEVETVKEYPKDYKKCCDEAQKELRGGFRPELKRYPDDLSKYDVIFVGFPSWWGTMPTAMFAFLEKYDLTGKRVIPFCTNEGSGMGNSERDLKSVCKGAFVAKGLSVRGTQCLSSGDRIAEWAKKAVLE